MKRRYHALFMAFIAATFTLAAHTQAFANSLNEGMRAYETGKYEKAFELLLPLAQEGDASAQSILGSLYMEGKGTPQNLEDARRWLRRASMKGNSSAQYNYSVMLFNGEGGPRDDIEAYKWMYLSWKSGNKRAGRRLMHVANELTRQEKADIDNLVKDWQPGNPIPGADKDEDAPQPKKERKLFVD